MCCACVFLREPSFVVKKTTADYPIAWEGFFREAESPPARAFGFVLNLVLRRSNDKGEATFEGIAAIGRFFS
jgi:hypothetical protein